jgi:hypothetical protein
VRNWKPGFLAGCVLLLSTAACQRPPAEIDGLLQSNRASTFVFLAPDCPLSQSYTPTLNTLYGQFSARSVGFYGVVSGDAFGKTEIDEFVRRYGIKFPTLADPAFHIADFLAATKTPEVFVLDPRSSVIYRGAVDNWAPALGQHREVITEHYLLDALSSFIENKPVRTKQTEAVGCFIERKSAG